MRLQALVMMGWLMLVPALAGDQKFAVVDMDRLISHSKAGKKMNADLDSFLKEVRASLEPLETELSELRAEIQKPGLDEAKGRELARKIEEKALVLRRNQEDKLKEIREKERLGLEAIEAELVPIMKAYTEREGLNMMFSAGMESLIFVDEALDITEALIAEYDAKTGE